MKAIAIAVVIALAVQPAMFAGPLLESAKAKAVEMAPELLSQAPVGCAEATANGQELANRREGMGGYLAGGIFIPVIMPLIGMAARPSPPASELRNVHSDDLGCFQDGYRERGRAKKVKGGWIGTGISVGMWVAAVAALAASDEYSFR